MDGSAGYALSSEARQILDDGDRRIFERRRATLAEGWVLAVFSVPESERRQRHLLRSRLSWLGFGTVGNGVWIAPGHLEEETRLALERHGLASYVDLFHASYRGFADLPAEVRSWWDLDSLDALYRQFDEAHGPVLASWRQRRRKDDEGEAFADYVRALTAWRRLPLPRPGARAGPAAARLDGCSGGGHVLRAATPSRGARPPLRRARPRDEVDGGRAPVVCQGIQGSSAAYVCR